MSTQSTDARHYEKIYQIQVARLKLAWHSAVLLGVAATARYSYENNSQLSNVVLPAIQRLEKAKSLAQEESNQAMKLRSMSVSQVKARDEEIANKILGGEGLLVSDVAWIRARYASER